MSMKNKFKNFFYLDEYEEERVQEQPVTQQKPAPRYEKPAAIQEPKKTPKERRQKVEETIVPNLVSLQSASKSSKVSLAELESMRKRRISQKA